ncbi:response regulator [Simkania negevensis]|uniref:histidine kinase n=1 Tax=Simkania negevensis TaxID=83561 RepID=A0ABS3ASJ4_9BACT|nr:response regulator [Simkania negevensis]
MDQYHTLLQRQLKKLGNQEALPVEFENFVKDVNDSYIHFEQNREILERAMQFSSSELETLNKELSELNRDLEQRVKERTQQLEESLEQVEKANASKSLFLANVSHELRTPLTTIIGFTQILEKKMKETGADPASLEYIELIITNSFHLVSLIDRILDISKFDIKENHCSWEDMDLKQFFRELESNGRIIAAEKKITFICTMDPNLPHWIRGDRSRFKQIVINLFSNAFKFTEAGKSVSFFLQKEGEKQIKIVVEDEGIGIPEDKFESIFNVFEQIDPSIAKTHRGVGLGLAICKQLVQSFSGTISVESKQGKGSTFTVLLPLIPPLGNNKKFEKESFSSIAVHFDEKSRVLLVEDNPANQYLLVEILKFLNISKTYVASDGVECLNMLEKVEPDLIIMDLHMPVMDGLRCLELLRANKNPTIAAIPVIVCTADISADHKHIAGNLSISGYLIKPIEMSELVSLLMQFLKYETLSKDAQKANESRQESPETDSYELSSLFRDLSKTPIYLGSKIIAQLQKTQNIENLPKEALSILEEIHAAVYSGNEQEYTRALDHLNTWYSSSQKEREKGR